MFLYFLIMVLIAFLGCNERYKKIKFYVSSSVLFSLMAFKSENVGNDTHNYVEFFYRLKYIDNYIDQFSRFEMGYQLYVKFIGMVFDNVQWLFFITAIICIGSMTYIIKKLSLNWLYSLFLLVGLRFYYFFLSGLRQSIAVSIVCVSFTLYLQNKKKLFYILILVASLFHFSALIFLLTPVLVKIKVNKNLIIKFLVVLLVCYFSFDQILGGFLYLLPSYYSHYLDTKAAGVNNIGNFIGAIIPICFVLIALSEKIKDKLKYYDIYIVFLLMASAISFLATRASILDRFVQYFWIFSIISITNIIFSFNDKLKRSIVYIVTTAIVIIYNLTLLYFRPEWHHIVPYTFFFE